eukprot:6138327-Amphidinium_carterae.1
MHTHRGNGHSVLLWQHCGKDVVAEWLRDATPIGIACPTSGGSFSLWISRMLKLRMMVAPGAGEVQVQIMVQKGFVEVFPSLDDAERR